MKSQGWSRPLILIYLILLFSETGSFAQMKSNNGWKAGLAKTIITPQESMWMAGFGDRTHPSNGKITDLWAKALALEDADGKRSVIVTLDLVGIPKKSSDFIRDELQRKSGLDRSQIILNTSHTHSGPVLSEALQDIYPLDAVQLKKVEDYTKLFNQIVINTVENAFKNMKDAKLFSGNGIVRFQVNRRNNTEALLTPLTSLNGPNDYSVPVFKVTDNTGKLMAIVFGYACHNTSLHDYKWAGDYAGFAQLKLEEEFPGATAMFFQGCGADQNPLPRRIPFLSEQYGEELASAVKTVINQDMSELTPHLSMSYKEIDLPLNPPPSEAELKTLADKHLSYQSRWAARLLSKIKKGEPLITSYPYPIEVWKVGEQPLIILGGEVTIDYAIDLKYLFGENIFVMGYSNDVMSYIPTPKILREGRYEGSSAPMVYGLPGTWRADAPHMIMQSIIELAKETGISIPPTEVGR